MIQVILAFLLVSLSPIFVAAQSLKEIRLGSSNISVTNLVAFSARSKICEAGGFDVKMIIAILKPMHLGKSSKAAEVHG